MPQINTKGRNSAVQAVARWFDYSHLPEPMQGFAQQFYDLAANLIHDLPDDPEMTVGLRKLLESKDCFVRAAKAQQDNPEVTAPEHREFTD